MATFDAHLNFAYSTILTAPSPASTGTTLVIQSGEGARFPAVSFNAVIWPANAQPLTSNAEIVRVTVISTDTFTITRMQESTSARSIIPGDQIAANVTLKMITDIEGLFPTGTVVGTTDTQTLTNKKLSDSTTSIVDVSDSTKAVQFDVAGTAGITGTIATVFTTAKTITIPDATDTLVGKATADVLTNKTLTSPTLNTPVISTPTMQNWDGWEDANESWTFATASTINVPTGAAAKYSIGDRIKWTQTTVRYGVIVAVADTLLTIAINTDYVVANAAISANFYSHVSSPIGFPQWFTYTSTLTGFSANPTGIVTKFAVNGRVCTVTAADTGNGTSNSTSKTWSLPITGVSGGVTTNQATDNGVSSVGYHIVGTTTCSVFFGVTGAAWTNSGNCRIFNSGLSLSYQI